MNYQLHFSNQVISYTVRKNQRARHLRLAVTPAGEVVLTLPQRATVEMATRFLRAKAVWVLLTLKKISEYKQPIPEWKILPYIKCKARARKYAQDKVREINKLYHFCYHRISVKNHSSRWGSCSKQGNLNFNYRILFLPEPLAGYIVVHELCHLGQMNHSKKFWALVARVAPDYKERRRELRRYHLSY